MQGTKQPGKPTTTRLWIAGISTAAMLLGCEAQPPLKDEAANSNQPSTLQEAKQKKEAVAAGAIAPQAAPVLDINQPAGSPAPQATDGFVIKSDAAYSPLIPGEGENYMTTGDSPVKQVAEAPVSTFS